MAEAPQKRLREDSNTSEYPEFDDSNSISKRQKPYNNILSLLDEEVEEADEEPTHDLSAIFTTLEQEISSSTAAAAVDTYDVDFPPFAAADEFDNQQTAAVSSPCSGDFADEDDGVKSVMRHLLEASDDELGIPNTDDNNGVHINYDNCVEINYAENFPFGFSDHGIWELEDVAANYYSVLQSELFM